MGEDTDDRDNPGGSGTVLDVPSYRLVGFKYITYLFGKSRVVKVSEDKRTYHIIYQLVGPRAMRKRASGLMAWLGLMMPIFRISAVPLEALIV